MYKEKSLLSYKVITPLHAGMGSGLGVIDLPIQREKHTNFPKIEASTLKGCFRESLEQKLGRDTKEIHLAFGCDGCDLNIKEFAGALGFSDARILLFPIKSVKGIFAYATCPYVIQRFNSENIGFSLSEVDELTISKNSTIALTDGDIVLEEYAFNVSKNDKVDKLADALSKIVNIKDLKQRLIILPDDEFTEFVSHSTEVITRNRINNDTGTVDSQSGGLFTEEYLPAESVLYSLLFFGNSIEEFKDKTPKEWFETNKSKVIQIGGNSTLGKGIVEVQINENSK